MAQPHLGERTQLRFHAPKALVDVLDAYAAKRGLAQSRTTSDLLAEAAGHPDLVLNEATLIDFGVLAADLDRADSRESAILKFRAPRRVVETLDRMGREAGLRRSDVAIHLLCHAVGLSELVDEGAQQLQMTG